MHGEFRDERVSFGRSEFEYPANQSAPPSLDRLPFPEVGSDVVVVVQIPRRLVIKPNSFHRFSPLGPLGKIDASPA